MGRGAPWRMDDRSVLHGAWGLLLGREDPAPQREGSGALLHGLPDAVVETHFPRFVREGWT